MRSVRAITRASNQDCAGRVPGNHWMKGSHDGGYWLFPYARATPRFKLGRGPQLTEKDVGMVFVIVLTGVNQAMRNVWITCKFMRQGCDVNEFWAWLGRYSLPAWCLTSCQVMKIWFSPENAALAI